MHGIFSELSTYIYIIIVKKQAALQDTSKIKLRSYIHSVYGLNRKSMGEKRILHERRQKKLKEAQRVPIEYKWQCIINDNGKTCMRKCVL